LIQIKSINLAARHAAQVEHLAPAKCVSKMTCRELTKLGFQDFAGITMWLSGYYNASVRNTVVDLYQFAQGQRL
jgi:hypothetical protein